MPFISVITVSHCVSSLAVLSGDIRSQLQLTYELLAAKCTNDIHDNFRWETTDHIKVKCFHSLQVIEKSTVLIIGPAHFHAGYSFG